MSTPLTHHLSSSSPLHLLFSKQFSYRNTPSLSFYSLSSHSSPFPSLSLKPKIKTTRSLNVVVSALGKLSDTELVSISPESANFPATSGVYAVYDANNDLQFVGISRNIAASIVTHSKSVPELCSSVKVQVVEDPDRAALTQAWKTWMEEHIALTGKVPPGNETGNTTWVKKTPPKTKSDLKLTPGPHVKLTIPLETLIDKLVKENKVVAFIKGSRHAPLCGFSQRVIGILESVGVEYESVDVLDEKCNNGLRESLKSYSNWPTFPQVFVDGELIGGCDILMSLYENGDLVNLLKK